MMTAEMCATDMAKWRGVTFSRTTRGQVSQGQLKLVYCQLWLVWLSILLLHLCYWVLGGSPQEIRPWCTEFRTVSGLFPCAIHGHPFCEPAVVHW